MATYDLGKVVGDAGEKGDDGSTVWNTSTAPTYANSKYTFTISNLSGKTGLQIAVNDIIFYSTYYYIVSAVNTTTVDCSTRVSIKGSDASVTIVDNLTSTSSTSALSAKQGKVLNDNKVETSAIATSWGGTTSDSKVPSEKLTKDTLDTKIAKSSTSGLVKNDGTIDTSSYLTSSALSNYMQKSSTSGLMKNDGTVDTTSYSTFSGSYNDLSNKPTIPSLNVFYGTSSTSASTQVKAVTVTGWSFTTGNVLFVKFDNANSYNGTAQIKIGSTTKDIAISGTATGSRYHWIAGEVVGFVYDGTRMVMIDDGLATTTYYGVTKLSSSTSSTSESVAATPKAVKTAYDLADGKLGSGDVGAAALSNSYADLDNKPSIPASSSDLSDGSDLVKTSSTTGLLKNDGGVMQSGTGASNWAVGNHTHSGYVSATKVTSWQSTPSDSNVPSEKLVKDYVDGLIGSAISYIVGSGS